MLWGNLETFEQNPVKRFRNRNPSYEKLLKIFSPSFGIQHMQLEKLGSAKEKEYLKFIAYIIQPKENVASRAESKKTQ